LLAADIPRDSFAFIPFPIDQPKRLPQFLPRNIPILTTVYDTWNEHKIKVLEESGYTVEVLWRRREKKFSGHAIRDAIKAGSNVWKEMVPNAALTEFAKLDLESKIRSS
jgi:hypothetical protein